MRIYDPRLGRFLTVDPITSNYPELTPYQFASNRPIDGIDLDGLEWGVFSVLRSIKTVQQKQTNDNSLSCIIIQHGKSNNIFSQFWNGFKDSYNDTRESFSPKAIKKTGDNIWGTIKDIGRMSIGKPGAAKSFSNRMVNLSKTVSDPIVTPVTFLGTIHTRTAQENAYGFGYFTFQVGLLVASDKILSELNGARIGLTASYEGNQIIRNGINGGARVSIIQGEEAALMTSLNKQAGIRWLGAGKADIQITANASRATIMEEFIHYDQYLKYGEEFMHDINNLHKIEIEAKNKLLEIGKKENWTSSEIDKINAEKQAHEKRLK